MPKFNPHLNLHRLCYFAVDQINAMSDNDAAKQVQKAGQRLFQSINRRAKAAA